MTTSPQFHLYAAQISSISPEKVRATLATLPEKYRFAQHGTDILSYIAQEDGSARVTFSLLSAERADGLRKWFGRRFKGRVKFTRLITKRPKDATLPLFEGITNNG